MNLRPLPPQGSALPAAPHPDVMRELLLPDDLIIIPHEFGIVKHFFKKSSTNDSKFMAEDCASCPLVGRFYFPALLRPERTASCLDSLPFRGEGAVEVLQPRPFWGEDARQLFLIPLPFRGEGAGRGGAWIFVYCCRFFLGSFGLFDSSVHTFFSKRLDKPLKLWYNVTSVRTANVRPSPYRVKFAGAV